jgi:protein-disulfide isomerase
MTHDLRKRRLAIFGAGLLVLIAAVAVVIAVSSAGGSKTAAARPGIAFAGIPQSGNTLGAENAPKTLMIFADMQCPFCREFETQAFPSIVKNDVRSGQLRVVFQPISILGGDSTVAARAVVAAAQQNKFFDYASTFYANQGEENTGYVTEDFMTKIARSVPGLSVKKWNADLTAEKGTSILSQAQTAAQTAQVDSTPTFLVAKAGKPLTKFEVSALTANAFQGKLDALTK